MTILVSKEEILNLFRSVHGEKFEYDLSNFKNKSTKINVCCREHGVFVKTGWKHLQGQGCPTCSRTNSAISRSKTHEEFLLECIEKHGEKYDYSLTKYKGANSLITITCREHGNFTQKAVSHSVLGYGCVLCGAEVRASKRRITKEQFISRAEILHKFLYDYSNINYVDTQVKVGIKCKTHGNFYQTPEAHLGGQGCPECGRFKNTRLLTTFEFIENARKIHGGRYSYDLVEYEGATKNVSIVCSVHGVFKQKPSNHLNSKGCPKCSVHGFKLKEQGCLYILSSGNITKIGITNNSVAERCKYISRKSKMQFCVIDNFHIDGFRCLQIEQKLLKYMRDSYQQPSEYFHGYSECFYDVDLEDIRDKIIKEINEKEIKK